MDPISRAYENYYTPICVEMAALGCERENFEDVYGEVFMHLIVLYRKSEPDTDTDTFYTMSYVLKACRRLWFRQKRNSRARQLIAKFADQYSTVNYAFSDKLELVMKHFRLLPVMCKEVLGLYLMGFSEKGICETLGLRNEKEVNNKKLNCKKTLCTMVSQDPIFPEINE